MSRREAVLTAVGLFAVALVVRAVVAAQIVFPKPEDTAYYVDVARNLIDGHGLVADAMWSYQTPPLQFPRPAFEVWLPLPTFLAAIPMALLGTTFGAAQVSSVLIGSLVPVLAWRLAADVAAERGLTPGRARTLALGHRPHDGRLPPAPAPQRPAGFDDAVRRPGPGRLPADEPDRPPAARAARAATPGSSASGS